MDYVGFQLQAYVDGRPLPPTHHSLEYSGWEDSPVAFYRDLSHLNPIKRELALAVPMRGGYGEDRRWADSLRELRIVHTQHYVSSVMYYYYFRTDKKDGA